MGCGQSKKDPNINGKIKIAEEEKKNKTQKN